MQIIRLVLIYTCNAYVNTTNQPTENGIVFYYYKVYLFAHL